MMNPEIIAARIPEKLRELEREYGIRILHAAEVGSRAWGTASESSDFDVRFLYICPRDSYLQLEGRRDVLEIPITEGWDMSGWDLSKALQLLHGSNPRLYDWFLSPVRYRDGDFAQRFLPLLEQCFCVKTVSNHYLNQAANRIKWRLQEKVVRVKDYVYAVHFLMQCGWVLDWKSAPPLDYQKLMDDQLPEDIFREVDGLRQRKINCTDQPVTLHSETLDSFLAQRSRELEMRIRQLPRKKEGDWELLNRFFLEELKRAEAEEREVNSFCAMEQRFLTDLLERILGTEGRGADEYCCVETKADERKISWWCDYSVSGYNYCAETEYVKTVSLRIEGSNDDREGFEKVGTIDVFINCQGVNELLEELASNSKSVHMRRPPEEKGRRFCSDAEFLFEDLYGNGKTVILHYTYFASETW